MKRLTLTLTIIMAMAMGGFAQDDAAYKIGYVNIEFIVTKHPDYKKAESEIKTYRSQLQKELQNRGKELQELEQKIRDGQGSLPKSVLKGYEEDYQYKMQQIQVKQSNYEMDLMEKQEELLTPIIDDIQEKVDEVAEEKNYNYILTHSINGSQNVVYAKNPERDNITFLVLEKLGVDVDEDEVDLSDPDAQDVKGNMGPAGQSGGGNSGKSIMTPGK